MKYEYKFKIPPIITEMTSQWLDAMFLPDPDFPSYQVKTLYFDKFKFDDPNPFRTRIRWYRFNESEPWGKCYAEIKFRDAMGKRKKIRYFLGNDISPLNIRNLSGDMIASLSGLTTFRGLRPILSFSYQRNRFISPDNRFSINHDTNLQFIESYIHRIYDNQLTFHPLPSALELKSNDPSVFHQMSGQFARFGKQGFSKYLFFYKHLRRPGEFKIEHD